MEQTTEEQANISAFRRIHEEMINTGNVSLAPEVIAADSVTHRVGFASIGFARSPAKAGPPVAHDLGPVERMQRSLPILRAAFPDLKHSIVHIFAKGDWVAARWRLTATHKGPFMGLPATGNAIDIEEAGMMRFVDGKLAEGWFIADELTLIQALGVGLALPA